MSGYSWEKLKSAHRKNAEKLGLKFGNFGWVGTKDSILSKTDKGYFGTTYIGPGKYKHDFEPYDEVRKNPPFYAHNLYEKKTHGLNYKQMRRLYAMVSRGNQKAITYARNVLGIPFSESPSQVKAVVLHHVRDLGLGRLARRVRRNPAKRYTLDADMRKHYSFAEAKRLADERVRRFGMRGIARGVSIQEYKRPEMIRVGGFMVKRGSNLHKQALARERARRAFLASYEKRVRGNPARSHRERIAIDTVRHPMKGYFLGGPDLAESVRYLRSLGYSMAQLKKLNPEVEDILEGRKSILPNRRVKRNPFGGETLRSFKQKYKGFEIIVEIQPNTILATWTNGDILESDRFSGYELDEIFEEVKARIDALKRRRR